MECPLCGASSWTRDHASPRAYALILLGAALAIFARVIAPAIQPAMVIEGEGHAMSLSGMKMLFFTPEFIDITCPRLLVFGIVALALGVIDILRDGSRYCRRCGFRARFVPGRKAAPLASAARQVREAERHLAPDQPVEPLLKMLRFKDERMRVEAADTLHRLTGQGFGPDAEAWEKWWAENKEAYKASRHAGNKH